MRITFSSLSPDLMFLLFVTACLALFSAAATAQQPAWKPVPGHIMTRWAKDVDPANPLPDYPRPTLVREKWQNLNGLWNYAITGDEPGSDDAWAGKILVPFPIESALSGVKKTLQPKQVLHYARTFTVPADWLASKQRVLLHFGAVDWHCRVRVNGKPVGEHSGGYDPFSFDITDKLKPSGDNEIIVMVVDPTNTGGQPRGKQWSKPHGIWYTPTTGIWQTVWIEPVPDARFDALSFKADPATGRVELNTQSSLNVERGSMGEHEITVSLDGNVVFTRRFPTAPFTFDIKDPKPWAPDAPTLYDVTLRTLHADGTTRDSVKSYFAFRDIKVAKDSAGINRLMLNGKPVFMFGPLDQGFWPDGLYTAPTDEALKFDIEAVKKMGGNMLRKHVKVEPERFYYWCDRLGIMVWQDMPSPFFEEIKPDGSKGWDEDFPPLSDDWKQTFEREWRAIIDANRHHPSIVMWVPFNEGWGQNDLVWAKSMVLKTKEWDPSRLVNNASGWTDMHVGDVSDAHLYPGPGKPANEDTRASTLGEYGGLGLPLEGHTWVDKNNWGYVSYKNKEELTKAYIDQIWQLPMLIADGLCAAVYTQTTDVEIEVNGWLTYDREVWKIDPDQAGKAFAAAMKTAPKGTRVVIPRAGQPGGPGIWYYNFAKPEDNWNALDGTPDFVPDGDWNMGPGGFGSKGTPGAIIGTEWTTSDIWLRRDFDAPAEPNSNLMLSIHHDEDAEIYINGVRAATLTKYTTGYRYVPISEPAYFAIKWGKRNSLAIHCHQTAGGQYIDCGIVEILRDEKSSKPGATSSLAFDTDECLARTNRDSATSHTLPEGGGRGEGSLLSAISNLTFLRPSNSQIPTPISRASTPQPRENLADYETRTLAGFTLKINKDFIARDPALLDRVLVHLHADLDQVVHFLPPAAADAIRTVTVWVEHQGSRAMGRGGRGMCCHWSPSWLTSNGLLPEKAGGIEIINPDDFLTWRRDQPYMCFHELAHAYHWRLAKLDPEIEAVFQRAKDSGIYDQVARNSLAMGKTERAYAITNSHEYFAELSEAYFALNDFYPYSRRQLAEFDPEGLRLMERIWKLSADEIKANTAPREPASRP